MSDHNALKESDFPIETEKENLRTCAGKKIGSAVAETLAENIAERLNQQAHTEEEDRWSA